MIGEVRDPKLIFEMNSIKDKNVIELDLPDNVSSGFSSSSDDIEDTSKNEQDSKTFETSVALKAKPKLKDKQ